MKKIILIFIISFYNFPVNAQSIKASDSAHYLKPAALIIPASFIIYGGLKPFVSGISTLDNNIMNSVQTHHAFFHTSADDYLMWAPSASIYALDAFEVNTVHNFQQHIILDASSIIITGALGYGMRLVSKNISAYKTHGTKFPSGHAANAFRGAELLHQELKYSHPVLSYSGFIVAAGVGLLRIYNKDHLLSEVITGAGLGILSSKITYWIFSKIQRSHRKNFE